MSLAACLIAVTAVLTAQPDTITFQDMMFRLPGSGWTRSEDDRVITLTKSDGRSDAQSLSAWRVTFQESERSPSQEQHTTGYFDFERHQARPPNVRWEGFSEAVRTIAGHQYAVADRRSNAAQVIGRRFASDQHDGRSTKYRRPIRRAGRPGTWLRLAHTAP